MEHKFTDKNHPPVPTLKVGDICYAHCPWIRNHSYVSTCEIRKVEVKWNEGEDGGYWNINYYIRTDIDNRGLKSTKMYAYKLGDDGRTADIFLTPQEVMAENIERFKSELMSNIKSMAKTMKSLGMEDKKITIKLKMLEQLK